MRQIRPLDALFPGTRQALLAATLTHPERAWYASELARRMNVTPSTLQRELRDLTRAGILKSHRQGRMAYYQANTESPVFADLRGLLLKTVGLVDVLADAFRGFESQVRWAFVYGSMASGREFGDSDVDLMVIGKASLADLALPLRAARETLGREINPTMYSVAEFSRRRAAHDHFLTQVMSAPKLDVLGREDELAKAPRQ